MLIRDVKMSEACRVGPPARQKKGGPGLNFQPTSLMGQSGPARGLVLQPVFLFLFFIFLCLKLKIIKK